MELKLFDYPRSSAAYRVRIALEIKGLSYEKTKINLLEAEHRESGYLELNPQGRVPSLQVGSSLLAQSLAIIEYLEEIYPEPALLPSASLQRAHVRSIAQTIACDIHPLNNLQVLQYLKGSLGVSEEAKLRWYHHWIIEGFTALEKIVEGTNYCFGENPTLADVCLVPQCYNARRFEVDLTPFPKLCRIEENLVKLSAFANAHPDRS